MTGAAGVDDGDVGRARLLLRAEQAQALPRERQHLPLRRLRRAAGRAAEQRPRAAEQHVPRDQPGQGAAGSGRHHHRDVVAVQLGAEFGRGQRVADRAQAGGAAPRDQVRAAARRGELVGRRGQRGVHAVPVRHPGPAHGRAPGPGQRQRWPRRPGPAGDHQLAGQPGAAGRGRGGGAEVRARRPAGEQRVSALRDRRGDQELQQPGLVPAEREPGQVVALDQERTGAQRRGQPGRRDQRRGQDGQRHPGQGAGQRFDRDRGITATPRARRRGRRRRARSPGRSSAGSGRGPAPRSAPWPRPG